MPYNTRTMTPEETEAFIHEPQIGDLATIRRDGSPHVAPLWYHYDGANIYFMAGKSSVKVRNIRRDPRVMVSIHSVGFPLRYVLIKGTAEISGDNLESIIMAVHTRYRGAEAAKQTVKTSLSTYELVVITVRPTKKITWHREDV